MDVESQRGPNRRAFLLVLVSGLGTTGVLWSQRNRAAVRQRLPIRRRHRYAFWAALAGISVSVAWTAQYVRLTTSAARRVLGWAALGALLLAVGLAARFILGNTRDRAPGYHIHVRIGPTRPSATLRVGFGRGVITPSLARPIWLAGFAKGRRATAVHDGLWATAAVIDDGEHRLGLVSLDAIGLFHDEVIAVRERLKTRASLDYVVVTSTHNHSAPDLLGIWGPGRLQSGVDPAYKAQVIASAASALEDAAAALLSARMSIVEVPLPPDGLVADTRDPQVFDATLRMMHFTAIEGGATLGSIVSWGNHPETLWADNTEITADFPGYLRDVLTHGVEVEGRRVQAGLGGTHVYVSGAIGGLMTTPPEMSVVDPFEKRAIATPSHDKARAIGRRLGQALLAAVAAGPPSENDPRLTILAETLQLPLDNRLFRLAAALGVIERGQPRWNRIRTEIAVIRLGSATMLCVPGELYPEIANGGVVRDAGSDVEGDPVEVPPLRELAPGHVTFLFGLANDEIGYIIPQTEWDDRPPWLFGASERHYGEINSLGPETAPILYRAIRELMEEAPPP